MTDVFYLGDGKMTATMAIAIAEGRLGIAVSKGARSRVRISNEAVKKISSKEKAVYGINTGFGSLCNQKISPRDTSVLQRNLLLSHSVGVGENIDSKIAKLMLILKLHALCQGFSGVSLEVVDRILWHIDHDVIPAVPEQGSLGASGDLAPLSHLFLPLINEGFVFVKGVLKATKSLKLEAIHLGPKDGLALINGTQFIAAHCILLLDLFYRNLSHADLIGGIMVDALQGSIMPFRKELHHLRPFPGSTHVAARIYSLLEGSQINGSHHNCLKVQDPYSLRCMPQVHGASRSSWLHLKEALEIEMNSVTDNPVVFSESFTISGGNFHGQPLALPIDYACLANAELGSISDRRMYLALEGKSSNVPQLLLSETGLNSGFMILQYTAAALASENKTQCFPASADSIMTSLGQEDHVSMGSIGVRKALKVAENTQKILAIELLLACQALDFQRPLKSTALIERLHALVRSKIAHAREDRLFANDINAALKILKSQELINIEKAVNHDKYSEYHDLFEVY